MKNVYILHGILTKDPFHSSISGIASYVSAAGFNPVILSYGFLIPFLPPLQWAVNWLVVQYIYRQIEKGSVIIGHSNGCAVAWRVSQKINLDGLVLVNPALDSNAIFPDSLKFIDVYWSPKDEVTFLSSLVPFSDWGAMGNIGYKGEDRRVKQIDMEVGHVDIGLNSVMAKWGPVISSRIKEHLAPFLP